MVSPGTIDLPNPGISDLVGSFFAGSELQYCDSYLLNDENAHLVGVFISVRNFKSRFYTY